MFDVTPGRCLGEEAILKQDGGAVGYVGNTRFGRTSDNPFELAFWVEMLHATTLGQMFDACKQTCNNAWQQYALNLLGDPAMRVWSDRPSDLEIGIRPFDLCVNSDNSVRVSVYSIDPPTGPVLNAVVIVSQNGAPLARATTGRSGRAQLIVHPPSIGEVDVAVFGESLIPALRQCPVITCNP